MTRAQSSIELLLLLAALAAFLAVTAPAIGTARKTAEATAAGIQEKAALETVYWTARKAWVLGDGALLQQEIFLPVETSVSAQENGILFEFGSRKVSREADFPLSVDAVNATGAYAVSASNRRGVVRVEFTNRSKAKP